MNNNSDDKVLQQFYKAYYAWATAPELTEEFSPYDGLCRNLESFCERIKTISFPYLSKMKYNFITKSGLDPHYPFNPTQARYSSECIVNACHKNKERIAWVKKQIDEFYNVR